MPKQKLKKQMLQLMAKSSSIQSLNAEERLLMEENMLGLPENDMKKMIDIFKNEQKQITRVQQESLKEQNEVIKISSVTNSLLEAGRALQKAFLASREGAEKEESSRISDSLLNQLEKL